MTHLRDMVTCLAVPPCPVLTWNKVQEQASSSLVELVPIAFERPTIPSTLDALRVGPCSWRQKLEVIQNRCQWTLPWVYETH